MNSPHRIILASAGTGKTFRLSNRYIEVLSRGEDPAFILATTFTRKAAGEILERVLLRLSSAAENPKELESLQKHVNPDLTREKCRALTVRLAQSMHRLNIGTIDSFFARLLRGFALDTGAPAGWTIVDEESDADLRTEAVRRALDGPDMEPTRAVTLLRMLSQGAFGRGIHDAILSAVGVAYSAYLQSTEEAWGKFGRGLSRPTGPEVDSLLATVRDIPIPTTKAGEPNKTWQKGIDGLIAAISSQQWEDVLENGIVAKVVEKEDSYARFPIPAEVRRIIAAAINCVKRALLSDLRDRNLAAFELIRRFDRAYGRLKSGRGWMRFEDVPRALQNAISSDRLREMYYRLDARINHLLLDEFQDTSLDQFAILKPLLDELLSQGDEHGSRTVLCVGDIKQSLYSWRGAEPELLPRLPERWPQLKEDKLSQNHRSSKVILDAVNAVFGAIASTPSLAESPSAGKWQRDFPAHQPAKDLPGEVCLRVVPEEVAADEPGDDESPAPDATARMARFVADRVEAIRLEAPSATIAILTRTNTPIGRMIFELRARGIPAVGEHGNPLTDTPAASAAISAMHLADHPGDTAAYFHVASSPLGALLSMKPDDDEKQRIGAASRLRMRVARDGVAGVLRWIQRRLADSMDELGFARFDQLIALAADCDLQESPASSRGEGARPGVFAELAARRAIEPPELVATAPVRVMTVHKAKGLEFDAVILPQLDLSWKLKNSAVLIDRRDESGKRDPLSPISAVTMYPRKQLRALDPDLEQLFQHSTDRCIGEELCGLYVALTRAKRYLELIIKPTPKRNSNDPTAAKVLLNALAPGRERTPGEVFYQSRTKGRAWHHELDIRNDAPTTAHSSIRFAPAGTVPAGRLPRRSPSSLEGGQRIDLGELWRTGAAGETDIGATARDRGTAFHAMYESIEWLDDAPVSRDALSRITSKLALAGTDAWIDQFLSHLHGPAAAALNRARYAGRTGELSIRREWKFAIREDEADGSRILSGQFDRVVIGRVNGVAKWAEVVDFKTDDLAPGDEPALSESVAFYRPQIDSYKKAAAKLLNLPESAISACLVFPGPGRIVEL